MWVVDWATIHLWTTLGVPLIEMCSYLKLYVMSHSLECISCKKITTATSVLWIIKCVLLIYTLFNCMIRLLYFAKSIFCTYNMAVRVVEISNREKQNCSPKSNKPKGNFWTLRIGLTGSLSSLQKSEFLKLIILFFHYF